MVNTVAELRAARRYLTSVLLNLDLNANEITVGTLMTMLDHFASNPHEYKQVTRCPEL